MRWSGSLWWIRIWGPGIQMHLQLRLLRHHISQDSRHVRQLLRHTLNIHMPVLIVVSLLLRVLSHSDQTLAKGLLIMEPGLKHGINLHALRHAMHDGMRKLPWLVETCEAVRKALGRATCLGCVPCLGCATAMLRCWAALRSDRWNCSARCWRATLMRRRTLKNTSAFSWCRILEVIRTFTSLSFVHSATTVDEGWIL